jgi:hypothetical protein
MENELFATENEIPNEIFTMENEIFTVETEAPNEIFTKKE